MLEWTLAIGGNLLITVTCVWLIMVLQRRHHDRMDAMYRQHRKDMRDV